MAALHHSKTAYDHFQSGMWPQRAVLLGVLFSECNTIIFRLAERRSYRIAFILYRQCDFSSHIPTSLPYCVPSDLGQVLKLPYTNSHQQRMSLFPNGGNVAPAYGTMSVGHAYMFGSI